LTPVKNTMPVHRLNFVLVLEFSNDFSFDHSDFEVQNFGKSLILNLNQCPTVSFIPDIEPIIRMGNKNKYITAKIECNYLKTYSLISQLYLYVARKSCLYE
jgi:hypothetical protein